MNKQMTCWTETTQNQSKLECYLALNRDYARYLDMTIYCSQRDVETHQCLTMRKLGFKFELICPDLHTTNIYYVKKEIVCY